MRRFVLIAAVSQYLHREMPPLPGVRRDAERLRSTLEKYADGGVYRLFWLPDGKARRQDIINKLRAIARQAGATDQVIVYFGGHGWRVRNTGARRWKYCLLPYDATFASPAGHGLATDELGKVLKSIHAQELVVILDCCYSGGMASLHWTHDTLDELLEGWRSHFVMAASRGREEAGEDHSGGFFMKALCDALQGKGVTPDDEGRISAQQAWSHAADVASAAAARRGHEQVAVSAGISSPIYLTRRQRSSLSPSLSVIQPARAEANSNHIIDDADATPLRQAIFVVGAGAGQAINLFGELIKQGTSSGLDDVLHSIDRLGLASSQPGRFIASMMDQDTRSALLSTRSKDGEILPLQFQNAFRSIGELVEHRFRKEFRWFQLGQFLYMIPTCLVLEPGTQEHIRFVSVLESFKGEKWFPSGVKDLLSQYCNSARRTSAKPLELFRMANLISQIVFDYTRAE